MFNNDFVDVGKCNLDFQESGLLNVVANITRTGVFVYTKYNVETGELETIRQLRHPDDVKESLSSLKGIPVTNDHPNELLSLETTKEYVVGMTSDSPKVIPVDVSYDSKEEYVEQAFTVFDAATIDDIQKGKREVSLGYSLDLMDEAGTWNGEAYDCRQKNIVYNHLSIVHRARGGAGCAIQMDGKEVNVDGVMFDDVLNNNAEGEDMIFNFDGKEFEVKDDVHALLETLNAKAGELQANLDSAEAKLDSYKDEEKKKDAEKKEAMDADEFKSAVKSRVTLERAAGKVLGEVALDSLTDREIKEKVIATASDVALDAKSDAYVDARYDIVLETAMDSKEEEKPKADETTLGAVALDNANTDSVNVVADAKAKFLERLLKGEA